MKSEFFCFCYPTLLKPGMLSGGIYPPEPCITAAVRDYKHTIIVTVATAFTTDSRLITQADILFDGESVVDGGAGDFGYTENPLTNKLPDGTLVFLTSLFVRNVKFQKSGCYEIRVSLFQSIENGEAGPLIDSIDGKFVVFLKEGAD